MKIFNVVEIFDNGEFVTIVTQTGSAVHLPMESKHSITIHTKDNTTNVSVDLNQ